MYRQGQSMAARSEDGQCQPTAPLRKAAAASRINFVIAAGCDTIDRWLDSSSIVFAPIRAARNRSRSGEVVLSFLDTAYQVGLCLHAATLVFDVNREFDMRPCAA